MIQTHSIRVVAGLFFLQYITEKFIRQEAWENNMVETDYGELFGSSSKAMQVREGGVAKALTAIKTDRRLLEILQIPHTMLRQTLLCELYKLQAEDLLCEDFEKVAAEIRDIWASGLLKHLYIDLDFGDDGTRMWWAPEILKVFARSLPTWVTFWSDDNPGVDDAYLDFMYIWAEGFGRPTEVKRAISRSGIHPIEPGYWNASVTDGIPYIGIYAANRCFDESVFNAWLSVAGEEGYRRHRRNEKVCMPDAYSFVLALVARGFPVTLSQPSAKKPGADLISQIPGGYSIDEQDLVYTLAELTCRAVFRRYSAAGGKRAVMFQGFNLDKDWEDYGLTDIQNKWIALVNTICWGEEASAGVTGCWLYDRPAYLIRELCKIVKEEMHCTDIIE